jgi:hypothetical protein
LQYRFPLASPLVALWNCTDRYVSAFQVWSGGVPRGRISIRPSDSSGTRTRNSHRLRPARLPSVT